MKFKKTVIAGTPEILANDHYVGKPYDCTALTSLATNGIIPAGTIIPANDATAQGVLLWDVDLNRNPNGTIITHGSVYVSKMPVVPSSDAITAMREIQYYEKIVPAFSVVYDANGGTGSVTDANTYAFGATTTVKASTGLTAPTGKTFSKWNTKADGSGTDYNPAASLAVNGTITLYAVWANSGS